MNPNAIARVLDGRKADGNRLSLAQRRSATPLMLCRPWWTWVWLLMLHVP